MKYYNFNFFQNNSDSVVDDILTKRIKAFVKSLNQALVGSEIKAFGDDDDSLWGQSKKEKSYKIKKITSSCDPYLKIAESEVKEISFSVDISLDGYNSNSTGLLYTSVKAEKSFKSLIKSLLGNKAQVNWSEQGMQGTTVVNFDFTLKADVLMKDYIAYQKFAKKVQAMEKTPAPKELVENDIEKIFNKKLKSLI